VAALKNLKNSLSGVSTIVVPLCADIAVR